MNIYTYHIYISSTVCHMQLQVGYNLSYATLPNVVAYGVCKLEFWIAKLGFSSSVLIVEFDNKLNHVGVRNF